MPVTIRKSIITEGEQFDLCKWNLLPWQQLLEKVTWCSSVKSNHCKPFEDQAPGCSIFKHYNDVIMSVIASQITSLTIVYSTVYSGVDQRKYPSSASPAFCAGNSPMVGELPAQRASNAENVSIWWRNRKDCTTWQGIILVVPPMGPGSVPLWFQMHYLSIILYWNLMGPSCFPLQFKYRTAA